MKLTPEQKVFIEYGKARKALEIAKKTISERNAPVFIPASGAGL